MYDVVIIGCGITGAAAAFELSRYRLRVAVLERENDVACGTTKANSAILHAGYDPAPGSLMARLNVRGSALAKQLCAALDVPYRRTGSLVAALGARDLPKLEALCAQGRANGVPGLELLDGAQARALEPNLSPAVTAALHAPSAAICSPWEYCLALAETAVRNGAELYRRAAVTGAERLEEGWRLHTARGTFETRFVINAAGVCADQVHDLAAPHAFSILPSRGQYFLLDKEEGERTGKVVFQCPGPDGKGVLCAPTVHGNFIVGPNAEDVAGEDTATTAGGLDYVRATAGRAVPSINFRACIRSFAGVRAKTEREDFILEFAAPGFLDLAGICSPGLTAAPAIGEYAAGLLSDAGLALEKKPEFVCERRRVRFSELSGPERAALVAARPEYGRIVCRCETISEGEILDALDTPVPPCSVDGVKRRVNAGMGRCQGGFCGPRVVELLARRMGVDPTEIVQDRDGTWLLCGQTKGGENHV